jgi:predicted dehydrogenase
MANVMNVGLIECRDSARPFQLDSKNESNNFHIKKVLANASHSSAAYYPDAEFVQDKNAILQDGSIDLVIISSPGKEGMSIVTEALEAGKSVRIL